MDENRSTVFKRKSPEKEMRRKRITVASAKDKGRRLQQLVCKKISLLTGFPFGKDEKIASREMGQSGCDIRLVADAKKKFPWSVECKYQEAWAIPAWIRQAKKNKMKDTDWLLVVKKNRSNPVAIIDLDVFFSLLELIPRQIKGRKRR